VDVESKMNIQNWEILRYVFQYVRFKYLNSSPTEVEKSWLSPNSSRYRITINFKLQCLSMAFIYKAYILAQYHHKWSILYIQNKLLYRCRRALIHQRMLSPPPITINIITYTLVIIILWMNYKLSIWEMTQRFWFWENHSNTRKVTSRCWWFGGGWVKITYNLVLNYVCRINLYGHWTTACDNIILCYKALRKLNG